MNWLGASVDTSQWAIAAVADIIVWSGRTRISGGTGNAARDSIRNVITVSERLNDAASTTKNLFFASIQRSVSE